MAKQAQIRSVATGTESGRAATVLRSTRLQFAAPANDNPQPIGRAIRTAFFRFALPLGLLAALWALYLR